MQEIINLGTGNDTNDGDPLRTAMTKVQANTTELYKVLGWGYYQDDEVSNITVTASNTHITINGNGANSNSEYLPLEILGTSELWDGNKMLAIDVGDGYDLRFDFKIDSKTGSPTYLDFSFDIGLGLTPSIPIVNRVIGLAKTPPFTVSIGFPLFSLDTFVANGGKIFMKTDAGTITISSRAILIKRDYKKI